MSDPPKLATLKYLVSSVIGTSPGATVLHVTDRKVGGGSYALKVIRREGPDDDPAIERARAECEASAKVGHPSILRAFDFRVRRSWFVVRRAELLTEYVEGKPLSALSGLPVGPATLIFLKAASALAHLHRRGALHGDVRPSKILLGRAGQVKVRGYGLSLVRPPFKDRIKVAGPYAAPEQARDGALDDRTEVYGLGATMYHALTGQAPGRAEGRKLPKPFALNPKIPAALNDLLIACLQTQPDRRPSDMYDLVKSLEGLVGGMSVADADLAGLSAAPP